MKKLLTTALLASMRGCYAVMMVQRTSIYNGEASDTRRPLPEAAAK